MSVGLRYVCAPLPQFSMKDGREPGISCSLPRHTSLFLSLHRRKIGQLVSSENGTRKEAKRHASGKKKLAYNWAITLL